MIRHVIKLPPGIAEYPVLLKAQAAILVLLSVLVPFNHAASDDSGHVLGPGDLIQILVHGEEDLSVQVRIEGTGFLSYPFLGDIRVAGLTVRGLQERIDRGLRGDYLIDPDVRVFVQQYRPVYINGQVRNPGGYEYVPGLTVQRAVSLAGGFTPVASQRRMYRIREGAPNSERERVNVDSRLGPGDTLVINEGFF